MRLSQHGLLSLVQQNIVELKFIRRREKIGWPMHRRALVTNNFQLLNSAPGKVALHFKPPMHQPPYPWIMYNLVCCWDLMWQDYRQIPVESCDIITVIPTAPPEMFWNYFNQYLQSLSPQQKVEFMQK